MVRRFFSLSLVLGLSVFAGTASSASDPNPSSSSVFMKIARQSDSSATIVYVLPNGWIPQTIYMTPVSGQPTGTGPTIGIQPSGVTADSFLPTLSASAYPGKGAVNSVNTSEDFMVIAIPPSGSGNVLNPVPTTATTLADVAIFAPLTDNASATATCGSAHSSISVPTPGAADPLNGSDSHSNPVVFTAKPGSSPSMVGTLTVIALCAPQPPSQPPLPPPTVALAIGHTSSIKR